MHPRCFVLIRRCDGSPLKLRKGGNERRNQNRYRQLQQLAYYKSWTLVTPAQKNFCGAAKSPVVAAFANGRCRVTIDGDRRLEWIRHKTNYWQPRLKPDVEYSIVLLLALSAEEVQSTKVWQFPSSKTAEAEAIRQLTGGMVAKLIRKKERKEKKYSR